MIGDKEKRKFVCLLSTGIDSPVSAYLMGRYADIILVHAYNYPFIESIDKEIALKIARRLHNLNKNISKLYIIPHGEILREIKRKVKEGLTCVMCKRFMLKYGREIAKMEGAEAIITGDSLGQVASQTLDNIFVEQYGLRFPVLRPLIGFDKDEVVKIAKKIGTYDISIEENLQCKATPRRPTTRAKVEMILNIEKELNAKVLLEKAVSKAEIVSL